jgi:hypothetical protein
MIQLFASDNNKASHFFNLSPIGMGSRGDADWQRPIGELREQPCQSC